MNKFETDIINGVIAAIKSKYKGRLSEFATACGMTDASLSRFINRKHINCGLKTFLKMCVLLDITIKFKAAENEK